MLDANAKRVAWFLNLHRVFQFPKYSMAPVKTLRYGRRLEAENPEILPGGFQFLPSWTKDFARTRALAAAMPNTLRSLRSATLGSGGNAVLRLMTEMASELPFRRGGLVPLGNPDLVSRRALDPGIRAPIIRGRDEALQGRNRRFQTPGAGPAGFGKSAALAPANIAPASRVHSVRPFDQVRIAVGHQTSAFPESNPIGSNNQSLPDFAAVSQYGGFPPGQDQVADSSQPIPNQSSVSTLHIDGAALGRWAIQHLERSLGKPTTGMTGVDPRATVPRNRVSPF